MKKLNIRALIWLSVMVAAIFFGALTVVRQRHPTDPFSTKPMMDIGNLHTAVLFYEVQYGRLPFTTHPPQIEQSNALLMTVLTDTNGVDGPFMKPQTTGALLDPWGHPYHVYFSTNGENIIVVGRATVKEPIAIWSDGPNGVNEYGDGDDFRSWKQEK
jgi:hypothetical protein